MVKFRFYYKVVLGKIENSFDTCFFTSPVRTDGQREVATSGITLLYAGVNRPDVAVSL